MNYHNRIINCTIVYREAIGYTNVYRKGYGKSFGCFFFLHSPRIRCGGKHGQYFANAGPLYLRRIIVCVLITLQGSRFNETLPNWRSMDTIMGQNWSETRCCSGRSSTHQQRKRRSGFAIQTPKSLRYKRRKG